MSCKCDFGKGLSVCHCAACHLTFTSSSAFAMHQRIPATPDDWGLVECLDAETAMARSGKPMFMSYGKTPDGSPIWGRYQDAPRKLPSAVQGRLQAGNAYRESKTPVAGKAALGVFACWCSTRMTHAVRGSLASPIPARCQNNPMRFSPANLL